MKDHFLNELFDSSGSSADKSVKKRLRHGTKQELKINKDNEDFVHQDKTKQKKGWGTKHTGGRKLIRKWLKKQVGRPWNDVYSEISQLTKGKPHIKKDFTWEVDTNIRMINKKPYVAGWRAGGKDWYALTSTEDYPAFYVHPDDGLLKIAPKR